MIIHVVQPGDTIQSIAEFYGISEASLIQGNGINSSDHLVIGESLVITYPELTYTVKEGDTLMDIAKFHNVTVMQLLQNNPYLSEREYIYPGDIIIISYKKRGSITTHGNAVPFIDKNTLRKTLPYLTYLSVLNYTATNEGKIIAYYDDTEIIQIAKQYGVIPLMLLTTLTIQGEANIQTAYDILINEDYQNRLIQNIITILRTKGYYGVNISFELINVSNLHLIEHFYEKIATQLRAEGFYVYVIINPNLTVLGNKVSFARIDYTLLSQLAQNIIFMNYEWATNFNPPSPISSIYNINAFLDYLEKFISPEKLIIGLATIGYDWELPYSAGISSVYSLTQDRAVDLAREKNAVIQFDAISQTPFFRYSDKNKEKSIEHIVWFIDSRSINALLELVVKYDLKGAGIWNIMIFNTQLWLVINSQYEIEKVLFE